MARRSGSTLERLPRCRRNAPCQDFGNLHGVERGPLAQIIGDDPQIEPVRDRRVAADAADIDCVLAGRFGRRHIALVGPVIDDRNAGRLPQGGASLVFAERPLELDIDCLAMADEDRTRTQVAVTQHPVEDLAGLGGHLPLFLGRTVIHENVDMGDRVERDLFVKCSGFNGSLT